MEEIWKDIDGYNFYQVSNLGRVRTKEYKDSINRIRKSKIMSTFVEDGGYEHICLYNHIAKKYKHFFVHRLVAKAFIQNPMDLPLVNHKDCNKKNNCSSNLEWCDWSYNNSYGDAIAKRNASRLKTNPNGECWVKTSEAKKKKILQYDLQGNLIAEYPSATDAALLNKGFKKANIGLALKGKTKTAYGYKWVFKL